MGNLGGPEILVILVVALIVLGPAKLPEAARQVGKAVTELRKLSSGFQQEMRDAMVDPEVRAEAKEIGKQLSGKATPPAPAVLASDPTPIPEVAPPASPDANSAAVDGNESTPEPED